MSLQKYNIKPDGSLVPIDPARNEHLITVCHSEEVDAELERYKRAVEWLSSLPEMLVEADGKRYLLRASTATSRGQWEQVPAELAEILSGSNQ